MPSNIQFRTIEKTDNSIKYLFDLLGVKGKSASETWRNFIKLTREYVVNTETEKMNYQRPETQERARLVIFIEFG